MPDSRGRRLGRSAGRSSPLISRDYNLQRHWAHESREDGCHSPIEVLDWHKGTIYPPSVLDRILFATRYTRHLDTHGLLRFQNWKLYAERGLPSLQV